MNLADILNAIERGTVPTVYHCTPTPVVKSLLKEMVLKADRAGKLSIGDDAAVWQDAPGHVLLLPLTGSL